MAGLDPPIGDGSATYGTYAEVLCAATPALSIASYQKKKESYG